MKHDPVRTETHATRGRRAVRSRRGLLVAAVLVVLLPVGWTVGQAFRPADPPGLFVEGPERVAAHEPFTLHISADRPVEWTVRLHDRTVTLVEQAAEVTLSAEPGNQVVWLEATDGGGVSARTTWVVDAIAVPTGSVLAPERVQAGAPYTATVRTEPNDAVRDGPELHVDGRPVPLHGDGAERWALLAAPLRMDGERSELVARWRDRLGRDAEAQATVLLDPLEQEVQELRVPASVLAVVTDDARAEQKRALNEARADPARAPRWDRPFLLPIEGRGSSGFGVPR
ncbi:MAG: hypothetical protein WD336_02185, partial [Trueperaceae bacterium]